MSDQGALISVDHAITHTLAALSVMCSASAKARLREALVDLCGAKERLVCVPTSVRPEAGSSSLDFSAKESANAQAEASTPPVGTHGSSTTEPSPTGQPAAPSTNPRGETTSSEPEDMSSALTLLLLLTWSPVAWSLCV